MASNPASPIRGPRDEPSLPGLQEERDQVAWFPTSLESPTCSVRLLGDPLAEVDDGTRLSDVAAALMTPSKQKQGRKGFLISNRGTSLESILVVRKQIVEIGVNRFWSFVVPGLKKLDRFSNGRKNYSF